jgi:two-component system cell cycle response regulator CpdR
MTGPFTILFVEDDTGVRDVTVRLLESKGFRLLVAGDSDEAMRMLEKNQVDVLFTDVVMPGLNGIELAKQAKLLQPDLKVVFMTGYYSRAAEARMFGELLYKPVRNDELETLLEGLALAG